MAGEGTTVTIRCGKYCNWDVQWSLGARQEDNVNQGQEAHEAFLEEVPLELALKNEQGFTKH